MTASRHGRSSVVALLAILLLFALPGLAAAHAEFETSSPAEGETVEGTPAELIADFSEAIGESSSMRLLNGAGDVLAEGGVDPDEPSRLRVEPPAELAPGGYRLRWQVLADDGHLARGTVRFTVVAAPSTPPPTPSEAPPESDAPTSEPTGTPPATAAPVTPVPSASPGDAEPTASGGDVLIPILVAVVLVAALGGYLFTRRRSTGRP